jgi:hypothetical protein
MSKPTRRHFLATTAAAVAAGSTASRVSEAATDGPHDKFVNVLDELLNGLIEKGPRFEHLPTHLT